MSKRPEKQNAQTRKSGVKERSIFTPSRKMELGAKHLEVRQSIGHKRLGTDVPKKSEEPRFISNT